PPFFFPLYAPLPSLHSFPTRRSSDLLDSLGLGTIAMMSRSPGIRSLVRERHPELLDLALSLRAYHGRASFLATMFRVLDHQPLLDRKSTRLNSSHLVISYAVFCLKKK